MATTKERLRWLAATFAAAVFFRVALFFSRLVDIVFDTNDSYEYSWLATSLVEHHVFGFEGVPKMNRTPGYPAMLAAVYATVGNSQLAVTVVQVTLDALACVMVVDILRRARLPRVGLVVCALFATTCVFTSTYAFQIMTETFYTFVIVLAMWCLPTRGITSLVERRSRWRLGAVGILMGVATLTRPAFAVCVAAFYALAFVDLARVLRKRTFRRNVVGAFAILGLTTAAIVVPWMARNRTVFHAEFEKADHSHVTLLGFKTDIPTYRHYYKPQFMAFRKSYEEPFIMERPEAPPVVARYVYAGEREEVVAAFAQLNAEIHADLEKPIALETLEAFRTIAGKRQSVAPRLYVTAPLSRAGKFWIVPRVSVLFVGKHGANTSLPLVVGLTLYDCLYVLPGMLGLALGLRRARPAWIYAIGCLLGHTALHSLWHPEVQSRYAIPLFPLLCLGWGVLACALMERGLRPSAWWPKRLSKRSAR